MTLEEVDGQSRRMYMVNVAISRVGDVVNVSQIKTDPCKIMTEQELEDKAEYFYNHANEKVKIKAEPMVFDLDMVTLDWVKEQMQILGIKPRTLREQTHTEPSLFSQVINGKMPLSKQVKTIFFYYFATMHTGVHWRKCLQDRNKEHIALLDKYNTLKEKELSLQ